MIIRNMAVAAAVMCLISACVNLPSNAVIVDGSETRVVGACACLPSNKPLSQKANPSYNFKDWLETRQNLSENLIALSFSGGGVRASALAASVLERLKELDLTNQVAIVSSTSGGSVTAGYVAAHGTDDLSDLYKEFINHDNTRDLMPRILISFLTGANRSKKFADYLDERLLHKSDDTPQTFGDAVKHFSERPFVILNASDASTGYTFEFTQDTFSWLCSDLAAFRISEGVAASAAFPFLMPPITLKNNWDDPVCRDMVKPFSPENFEKEYKRRYENMGSFVLARYIRSLRYTYEPDNKPYRKVEFVHLLDGGLSDNLAARALLRSFTVDTLKILREKGVKRILLVQVNAKSDKARDIDTSSSSPSLLEVFKTVAFNPIDVTTALSSYISKEYFVSLISYMNIGEERIADKELYFYPVQVDFDLMTTGSDEQKQAKEIPTWWSLSENDLGLVGRIGKELLDDHPCFKAFIHDAKGQPKAQDTSSNYCKELIRVAKLSPPESPMLVESSLPEIHRLEPPPPPPPPVVEAPKPAIIEKGRQTLDVKFAFDKATIKEGYYKDIDDLIAVMKEFPDLNVVIEGHTDNLGSPEYNKKLSQERAEAVKKYMVQAGIDARRISAIGFGAERPVASNATDEGRAKNRRVEAAVNYNIEK